MKKRNAVALYSNVIMHNNAAIKFIESNKWHFYGIEKNYRDTEKNYMIQKYIIIYWIWIGVILNFFQIIIRKIKVEL